MFTRLKENLYQKLLAYAEHPKGLAWLGGLSFAESFFFPIPVDFFMVPMLVAQKTPRWFKTALTVTLMSVAGGLFGYALGYFLFDSVGKFLVNLYHLENELAYVKTQFDKNVFWAVFIAGFTPVPYKLFTVAGGFFTVALWPFFLASVISRGLRFFGVVYIVKWFGRPVIDFMVRYSSAATILTIMLTALVILAVLTF